MPFENLFSPVKLGTRTARNRIFFPSHGVGIPWDEYIGYQTARAKGGSGLNIIGPCPIHQSAVLGGEHSHKIETPEALIPKWKQMAAAVHEYGTLLLIQLWHAGDKSEGVTKTSWGVSENPVNLDMDRPLVPHAMTDAEINEVIDGYARYAMAAQEAGLDGCEIHGGHGYLPPQFWSPWINHRKDKWGHQLAFISEVINRIRAAVGKDFIFGIRMSGDDLYPGPDGLDIEKSKQLAMALEATGKIDYLNISIGHGGNSNAYAIANMYVPPGSISIPMSSGIKQVIKSIPVLTVGRINDPAIAEKAIADGHCDMVGLVRGHIADPEFGNKAREGRIDDIRLCIGCNQGCSIDGVPNCTQNYGAGRETRDIGTVKPAAQKKKVMIIGGGPAGLEAARVTALRGHTVTLYEKSDSLGGLINTLSKAPMREEFSQVTRFLTSQISKLGVTVKPGVEVTPDMVIKEKPDAVIVAIGARPYIEPVPGIETAKVVSSIQVLDGKVEVGRKVLIYDCTGEQEAPTTADYLGVKDIQVELVTSQINIGMRWGMNIGILVGHNPFIWQRLKQNGVHVTTHSIIKKISGRHVTLVDVWAGDESVIEDVDTVVMSTGYFPNNGLYKALEGKVKELYAVGDCVIPRRALNAIHDAYLKAFKI
jgi:2,4-dienoyl-CoA reductase-like NADH-dependent reductase (Old Yellow Enzyme family)/NADPH-dependent 2,4-dienoyl-CoA reductase/sulfur reductase-like enzyme